MWSYKRQFAGCCFSLLVMYQFLMNIFTELFKFSSSLPDDKAVILNCYHESHLVFLSYCLAVLSAYTALGMLDRVLSIQTRIARSMWIVLGGISLGCGIWAMHFTGIEAFRAPIPIQLDFNLTLLSMLVAMFFCCIDMWVFSLNQLYRSTIIASVLLGIGIVFMHYIGMAAMVMQASLYYRNPYFIASIIIAIGASGTALTIARQFFRYKINRPVLKRIVASLFMGVGIVGMHYTGMLGTDLVANGEQTATGIVIATSSQLIIFVAVVAALILIFSLVAVSIHSRWQVNQQHISEVESLVAELETAKQAMKDLAYSDPVTNLENRHSLDEALDRVIERHQFGNMNFSIFFLDLDDFKRVNDSYGHSLGDQLLKLVAQRLNLNVRPTDIVGRFGGDEFLIILLEEDKQKVRSIAQRIVQAMSATFDTQDRGLDITISLGLAHYPDHGTSSNEMIRNADIALYEAKKLGKNCISEFNSSMHDNLKNTMQLEDDLREALNNQTIEVFYQPIVDATTHQIVQLEALARWNNKGKWISPIEFISIAEERSLISSLGEIVLNKLLQDLSVLNAMDVPKQKIAFNLSPKQFSDNTLISGVQKALGIYKIEADQLIVELTENSLIKDIDITIKQLKEFKSLGFGISIDDFGQGYSSLSYLKRLPFDKLKIDRSFVTSLPDNEDDVAINQAILAVAKKLNLIVVAEGIETKEQADFFMQNGCDLLQGFYFSRPVPFNEIKTLLTQTEKLGPSIS